MTQYVQLTPDTTTVITVYGGPQPIAEDKPGYAVIPDTDARFVTWQAAQAAKAAVGAALAAGLQITSTSTPALNGTYAIDARSQQNISAIAAGIASRSRLPGGGSTFNYFDQSGEPHTFNPTNFLNFAAAVEDYVYALAVGGTNPPLQPTTIA